MVLLPDMIERRYRHASVSMGNKIFVIGGYKTSNCEVFDSSSRKFTSIKSLMKIDHSYFQAVCLDKVIVVLNIPRVSCKGPIYLYNIKSNENSVVDRKICEKLAAVSCVKYYLH